MKRAVTPPQEDAGFAALVARIAQLDCQVQRLNADLNTKLQAVRETFAARAVALVTEYNAALDQALTFAESHRAELLPARKKSVKLGACAIAFRDGKPSVEVLDEAALIGGLRANGFENLVRLEEHGPTKAALLALRPQLEPLVTAGKVAGLRYLDGAETVSITLTRESAEDLAAEGGGSADEVVP